MFVRDRPLRPNYQYRVRIFLLIVSVCQVRPERLYQGNHEANADYF